MIDVGAPVFIRVTEPSAFVLLGLSSLALLFFRCKY